MKKDIVIIGSGPAGLTAAIYSARAGLDTLLVAGMTQPGGALTTTTLVENYPGFSKGVMGPDLMDAMLEQAEYCGAEIIYEEVEKIDDFDKDIKKLHLSDGETVECKAIILSMGAEHKSLDVPGEEELTGSGISTCATCDGAFFKDKNVIVVGGGDSALEEATYLSNIVKEVILIHRRDTLRASQAMVKKMEDCSNITPLWNTVVRGFDGDTNLTDVRIATAGVESTMKIDGAFVAIGHTPRNDLVKDFIECDDEGYVRTFENTSTNISGIFACGDLVDKHYRQAITAAGSGCQAALDAQRFLA